MSRNNDDNGWTILAFLVLVLLSVIGDCWYNARIYGDWTCAFSRCVRVKP